MSEAKTYEEQRSSAFTEDREAAPTASLRGPSSDDETTPKIRVKKNGQYLGTLLG
jgi:hypothetical protein